MVARTTTGTGRDASAGDHHETLEEVSTVAHGTASGPLTRRTFVAMGSTVELIIDGEPSNAEAALVEAEREIHRLERMLSRFLPTSEISRLNAAGELDASPEVVEVVRLALDARERTGGRFDPTVHDAVVAAGYDRTFDAVAPNGPRVSPGEPVVAASPSTIRQSRSSRGTGSTSAASRRGTSPIGRARC